MEDNSGFLNIEIKAKCNYPLKIEEILNSLGADFKGIDHQIDTYFNSASGRLKLREGNIENSLIFYERDNISGPKKSKVILFKSEPDSTIKDILINSNKILVIVDKKRKIFFIENVKFHLDSVNQLGDFVEIEAIDLTGSIGEPKLKQQCDYYLNLFNIQEEDLLHNSYSDMLLDRNRS